MTMVLVVSDRPVVTSLVERCSASVGADVLVVPTTSEVRRSWHVADVVVVDAECVIDVIHLGLTRSARTRLAEVIIVDESSEPCWAEAVALGATAVMSPDDDRLLLDRLASVVDGNDDAAVLVVAGATGGLGATTFAAATALEAARRSMRSLILDADTAGPGLDLVLGIEDRVGTRWPDIDSSSHHLSARLVSAALPTLGDVAVLSGAADTPVLDGVGPAVTALQRAFDVVVADVSRHGLISGEAMSRELVARAVSVALVVAPDVSGLAAARRLREAIDVPVVAVVAAHSRQTRAHMSEIERVLGVPVVTSIRRDRAIARDVDAGWGPARARRSRRAASRLLDVIGVVAS